MYQSVLPNFLKACEGTEKQGYLFLSTFVTNSFEESMQNALYILKGISKVCGSNRKAQFNHFIVFRTVKFYNYV